MSILVRKIQRAKWGGDVPVESDVPADAITICLKTTDNTLSIWEIDNENELDDAIVALATGRSLDSFSKIDYVLIDESILRDNGLSVVEYDGDTALEAFVKKHKNISDLTYRKLGIVRNIIVDCINNDKHAFKTRSQIKKIVKSAIETGKLQKDKLNPKLIEKERL
jgi:hypothetical protein